MRCAPYLVNFIRGIASVVPPPRANYAVLQDCDLSFFEKLIGKKNVRTDDIDPFNTDFLKAYKGILLRRSICIHSDIS